MPSRADELIRRLHLRPHPEGGHYAEVFRSSLPVEPLDGRARRAALTSIYILLREGEFSHWHRVASDEVWCHLEGAPLALHVLEPMERTLRHITLGPIGDGVKAQHTVPAHAWQAARSTGDHSLAACIVGPGFDFDDFELMPALDPLRAWLAREHPDLRGF
jgi:predicted cupin superfamily sugar epimerase